MLWKREALSITDLELTKTEHQTRDDNAENRKLPLRQKSHMQEGNVYNRRKGLGRLNV